MNTAQIKVEYLDHMGSDLTVVNAARTSFGKESEWVTNADGTYAGPTNRLKPEDANLIRYLATGYRTKEWEDLLDEILRVAHVAPDYQAQKDQLTALLHAYKRRAQHWAPFAHPHLSLRMTLPMFLARQFVKHCVTGDTEVTFVKRVKGNSNGMRKVRIRDLYAMWAGQANKYQRGEKGRRNVRAGHVRVFDEATQRFATSHVTDVLHQGVKSVFIVTTESGAQLRATGDHEVLTRRGWARVDSLTEKDDMITEMGVGQLVDPAPIRWNDWTDKQARRGVPKDCCAHCGATEGLEADHVTPVVLGGGHEPENMQCLCTTCHTEKSNTEKAHAKSGNQFSPRYTRVVSVRPDGEDDVFDLTVEGTHNFVANGLVVHNCVGGVWSEESRRYIDDEPEVWFPDEWHSRPEDVKQGSGGLAHDQASCHMYAEMAVHTALGEYSNLLKDGVAPEEARIVLPLNTMTTVTWTGSLLFWSRVCNQRVDSHAQLAAQELGRQIADIVRPHFPVSWAALCGE